MRLPSFRRVLAMATLCTFLSAQQPAAELAKWRTEANAALQAKDYTAAAAAWRKVTEADPKDGQAWQLLGYSLHVGGKLDEALPAHKKAAEFPRFKGIASYNIACVYSLKGDHDAAFQWLDSSVAGGFADLAQLQGDGDFDAIRKDPRFAKIEAAVKAKGAAPGVQVFVQAGARKTSRAAWFSRTGSPGQIAVDWTPVPWQDGYDEKLAKGAFTGKKWRLGADFWTRLDTTFDMSFGSVVVPAGCWYLTLEQRAADSYVLAFHDANAVRKQKLDAFLVAKLQGGIEVPVAHTKGDVAKELALEVVMADTSQTEGSLTIAFGPHRLGSAFTVKLD